ncbi:Ubiquitin-protein ligase E3B [Mortierella antarctica]|nr:Ubiquitin-protein ligase E3B [Mortierella antarctica]
MFPTRPGADKKAALLAQAKADRLARSAQKKTTELNVVQDGAARRIQHCWRTVQSRRATKDRLRDDWDLLADILPSTPTIGLVHNLRLMFVFLRFYDPAKPTLQDTQRLTALCKIILSKVLTTASMETTPSTPGSPSPIRNTSPSPSGASSTISKPSMQVPFHMLLLHARYADQAAATLLVFIQVCLKAIAGFLAEAPSSDSDGIKSPKTEKSKFVDNRELYLSGPELRFLLAYLDINTYKLPESVALAIRTTIRDRAKALLLKVLNSGQFYKDIRSGFLLRTEAIIQLQERSQKTALIPTEATKMRMLHLWIAGIWRCCFLLQSVDNDSAGKASKHQPDLINLHSDDSTAVGITCHILSVPLFVNALDELSIQLASKSNVLRDAMDSILDPRHQQFILNSMSLNSTLYLLGNLAKLYRVTLAENTDAVNAGQKNRLVDCAVELLTHCQKYVSGTQTTEFRHYHAIFSWTNISQKEHQLSPAHVKLVFSQLEYLWSRDFAMGTFNTLLSLALPPSGGGSSNGDISSDKPTSGPHSRIASQASTAITDPQNVLLAIEVQQACLFYMTLMKSFESQKSRILVTLMYLPSFLAQLWRLMATLGPKGKMQIYLEAASGAGTKGLDQEPLIAILQVFCECCARFFITIDDDDMYEQQKPWELSELVFMSGFLNQFCFSVLSNQDEPKQLTDPVTGAVSVATASPLPPIFYHARQVLLQLYERDCRRAFCPPHHWLLLHPTKSVFQSPLQLLASLTISNKNNSKSPSGTTKKPNGFFSFSSKSPPQYATPKEFILKIAQKDRTALQILETMPHVIPFTARLEIFRDFIREEKLQRAQSLALVRPDLHQSVMVKIRRGYVLEDGYQQLGALSANGWKNTIRVRFVNEVGADEAGIDQGGPFKEFMETFLESGFSPNLNLFTTTTASMHLMYPSPTSHYTHPNTGLELFRLFGKMLGKAMYEGLLVEVKFAGFFLSKILGRTVFLDEMRSFDEEMFKNLMFLKKYEGDVKDLGLTFSLDENLFGTHRTIELLRGGKDVEVTKENRINYIFQVSDYRLNRQIQEQSRAFIDGFRSIIPLSWISIFSPQELHRVIAGDDVDFDVQDLRAYTEYQNGYFDQHPVIRNLWAVLNEFNSEEKRAFLKFVTSCSKPPLGGFKHLYPPFAIRLVLNPTASDTNQDGSPVPAPRQFGSGAQRTPSSSSNTQTQTSSGASSASSGSGSGFGSRLRSALNRNSGGPSSPSPSHPSPASSSSPFALTTDDHGTPAPMGVVKSFFGGVLGSSGSGSSESVGKKARLPTSSTCFNLLKLPPFSSKAVLKEKLRYAIMSNTGFELS